MSSTVAGAAIYDIHYYSYNKILTPNLPSGVKSLLLISALAATVAFFTANKVELLIHIGGSPQAIVQASA